MTSDDPNADAKPTRGHTARRGGYGRFPDPPIERNQRKARRRPQRERYTGIRRQIARANKLHPIQDRAAIDAAMVQTIALAKQVKRQKPRMRYRNVEITEKGVCVYLPVSAAEWGLEP